MNGEPLVIGGIPIPSDAPQFLTVLGIHVLFGLAAVVTGAVAMLSGKAPGRASPLRYLLLLVYCGRLRNHSRAVCNAMDREPSPVRARRKHLSLLRRATLRRVAGGRVTTSRNVSAPRPCRRRRRRPQRPSSTPSRGHAELDPIAQFVVLVDVDPPTIDAVAHAEVVARR